MKRYMKTAVLVAFLAAIAQPVLAEDFGGGEVAYLSVIFSHQSHVGDMGFECDTCHAELFAMEAGAVTRQGNFTMASLNQGQYCGACHNGEMAFSANSQCTSCHQQDGGEIVYTEPVQAILFSHKLHGDELGFECDACHAGLFEMKAKAAQQSPHFTMQALEQGEYCGACHDGSTAFASNTRCASCHIGVKGHGRLADAAPAKAEGH